MKLALSTMALLVCFTPCLRAADENPFKNAKVGDTAEYKMTTSANGMAFESTTKMTVTAKTEKELTYEMTGKTNFMGMMMDIPPQKQTIDLTKPYDPTDAAKVPMQKDMKVEKTQGKEKIKAGGKEYDCEWVQMKYSTKVGDMNIDSDVKIWTSKDAPVTGMVKMVMKSKFADMTMELTNAEKK